MRAATAAPIDLDERALRELLEDLDRLTISPLYRLGADATRRAIVGVFDAAREKPEGARLLGVERGGRAAAACVLQRAEWESGIYGVTMARIPIVLLSGDEAASRAAMHSLLHAAREPLAAWGVRHVSAIVSAGEVGAVHAFEESGWRLVDSTLELAWETGRTHPVGRDPRLVLREPRESDREPLVALTRHVYTSTIRTRFLADPWLPVDRTGELYALWLENALDGSFADHVVVAEHDGRPVGFNMLKIEKDFSRATGAGFAAHGIAAVESSARGLGAQPAMLHHATEWFGGVGGRFTRGRVLINNYPMQRACLKSGGFIAHAFHTFHTWLGEPLDVPHGSPRLAV